MEVELDYPGWRLPVYCKYDGQFEPQPAFIHLDCETGRAYADYASDTHSVPASVFHGHTQRWEISPYASCEDIEDAMDAIKDDLQTILDGYGVKWDGSNHIAVFTDEAKEAMDKVEDYLGGVLGEDYINENFCDDEEECEEETNESDDDEDGEDEDESPSSPSM